MNKAVINKKNITVKLARSKAKVKRKLVIEVSDPDGGQKRGKRIFENVSKEKAMKSPSIGSGSCRY